MSSFFLIHHPYKQFLVAFVLATLAGCTKARIPTPYEKVELGKTTVSELKEEIAITEQGSHELPSGDEFERYVSENGEVFQVVDGLVVTKDRSPDGAESTMQYWLHRWEGRVRLTNDLGLSSEKHLANTIQITSPQSKEAILFVPKMGKVIRVIHFRGDSDE